MNRTVRLLALCLPLALAPVTASFADLAKAVFRASNREPQITFVDMPEAMRDRYQYFTRSNPEKLRRAGYAKPFTQLEDGVGRYVRDFLVKQDPYL